MPIYKRFLGGTIDVITISLIFIVIFVGILGGSILNYINFKATTLFVIINIIYYLTSYVLFGASYGMYIVGTKIVDSDGIAINKNSKILIQRILVFLILMYVFIGIRYILHTTYLIISLIYFVVINLPIPIIKRSLVDILSGTYLLKFKEANVLYPLDISFKSFEELKGDYMNSKEGKAFAKQIYNLHKNASLYAYNSENEKSDLDILRFQYATLLLRNHLDVKEITQSVISQMEDSKKVVYENETT